MMQALTLPSKPPAVLLAIVTTVPETLNFFRGQIGFLKDQGFTVHAVSSPGDQLKEFGRREEIPVHPVAMPRSITPWQDIRSLVQLVNLFRQLGPTIVHAHTPKGGLLGVMAARLAGAPLVVYTIHGLPFASAKGLKRWLLFFSEKVACRGAHHIFAVSRANLKLAVASGLCRQGKIEVLGSGSVNGVDASGRFNPSRLPVHGREDLRARLGISLDALVMGFVGRIVRDKGIQELAVAWEEMRQLHPDLYLLLVGREEAQDPIAPATRQALKSDPRVVFAGPVAEPAPYYAIMDMLVLPTHREGFPVVPLEAAAMGLPVVTTTVDGCPEAVVDGLTGMLVPPRDPQSLSKALELLISASEMRKRLGRAGRERVLQVFQPEAIWKAVWHGYRNLLCQRGVIPREKDDS